MAIHEENQPVLSKVMEENTWHVLPHRGEWFVLLRNTDAHVAGGHWKFATTLQMRIV